MASHSDITRLREALVDACRYGDEARARELVSRLAAQPRKARDTLESMLADPDALVRQAAAFALGELGGAASARALARQLALEEARGDYNGSSVAEAITQALGRIEESSARTSLVRRLERLAAGTPDLGDVNSLARALWRKRHAELLPAVRKALEQLALSSLNSLHGLLLALEKSPDELRLWAREPSVPVRHKTEVVTVLEEDLPDAWLSTLASFISTAQALGELAASQQGEASYYCDRLFILLLEHEERALPALSPEARSELHALARRLVAGATLNCALRAAILLGCMGTPEDAELLEAHRPADPVLAEVFDASARAIRARPASSGPSP